MDKQEIKDKIKNIINKNSDIYNDSNPNIIFDLEVFNIEELFNETNK